MNAKELTVLMVEPGKHPKVTKIKESWVARIESCSFAFDLFWGLEFAGAGAEFAAKQPIEERNVVKTALVGSFFCAVFATDQ